MKKIIAGLFITLITLPTAFAQDTTATATTEVLLKTTQSWDGSSLPAFPQGKSEITISKITLPAGYQLPVHEHPNPLGGYIVSGELTVICEDGKQHTFKAGEALTEVVNTWHYGKNEGEEPVVLIAFYIGQVDVPLTVLKEN